MTATQLTIALVIALLVVLFQVGKRIYPNGSGDSPAWMYRLPNWLLILGGLSIFAFGIYTTWVSGQVLFNNPMSWPPLVGLLSGVLIALYGVSAFGVILLKREPI